MKSVGKKLILISFILALITSVVVFVYLKSLKTPETESKKVTILAAVETIPPRTKIEKKMIKEIEVMENEILRNYIMDSSKIVGQYTKEVILKDEGFHKDKLANKLENELSLKIDGNYRAISINVNGDTGVSDLIKQGDFVDVIVYLPEKIEQQKIVRPHLAKIILQNIEVLAIDKALFRDGEKRIEVPNSYLVTLSVQITDIERLVLAQDIGQLKLALRPPKTDYIHKSEGAIWEELTMGNSNEIENLFPEHNMKSSSENAANKGNYKEYVYYTIKRGDTLMKISREFYGVSDKYVLIKQVNGIDDKNKIRTGTVIKIPMLEK